MRSAWLLLAAALLLPGCVTRYVVISEVPKSELEIVVFTANTEEGEVLLEKLSDRGYTNEQNHIAVAADDEPSVKWGGAPSEQIEEIIGFVEGRYNVTLERDRSFKHTDRNVFINLPEAEATESVSAAPEKEDLRVVIFTDDKEKGEELLGALKEAGFDNDENYVTDEPNEDFNIKWGAAPEEMIDEIVEKADDLYDIRLERQHTFEESDKDIFINLPFEEEPAEVTKEGLEITVFCDSEELGKQVLSDLSELGYTNDENEVLTGPNDDHNIKYGGLPEAMLEELAGYLDKKFETGFRRSDEFSSTSRQVFINLPGLK
jgi:hypothetical protein